MGEYFITFLYLAMFTLIVVGVIAVIVWFSKKK